MPHENHGFLSYLANRELDEIYITMAMRTFAISMINIFIPVYFYVHMKNDLLMSTLNSVIYVMIFYVILFSLHLVSCYPLSKLANYIGFKHAILISMPIYVAAFLLIYLMNSINIPLIAMFFIIAILMTCASMLFWMAFHMDFAKFSKDGKRGGQVGILNGITTILNIIGPIVGGYLASLNFSVMFIVASVIMLLSAVPLFFSQEVHQPIKFKYKNVLKRENHDKFVAFLGEGLRNSPVAIMWPLFIFISNVGVVSLGAVYSIANFVMAIMTIIVGKKCDKLKTRKNLLWIGAFSHGLIIGVRAFFVNVYAFGVTTAIGGFTLAMLSVPFQSQMYDSANKRGISGFIILREFVINIARIFVIGLTILMLLIFKDVFTAFAISFIVAALGAMMMSYSISDSKVQPSKTKSKRLKGIQITQKKGLQSEIDENE